MNCAGCKEGTLEARELSRSIKIGEHAVEVKGIPTMWCGECGESTVDAKEVQRTELVAVEVLLGAGLRDGVLVKYAGKALGYTGRELAKLLATTPETMSRWENSSMPIAQAVVFASLIRDALVGSDAAHRQLVAARQAFGHAVPVAVSFRAPTAAAVSRTKLDAALVTMEEQMQAMREALS